ncbi:hypothetical protein PRIPAC_79765 [Pristionchus pacificus]|uniref:Membrane transporter n=1 Tax=Pristionchus pacificus TaxID=54126 RepID=A0A2A6CKW4_PRIPA|nr:hypothetical protein PRIPAC_79765 [Pristionchus pacificus]|eukprot:PDM78842.1 membrane transporter [Pristionchus pacificus]
MDGTTNWRNVRTISIVTFVDALQFSFYMWSFWPYIQQIDSTMGATFVGIIMAISGVGEALAAPIFGFWANKIGRILPPVYTSLVMSGLGNALYLLLGAFSRPVAPYAIVVSRFLSGAGTGNRGCFRALVACNSEGVDRAKALASSGGAALVGLTIGPAVQLVFNFMGAEGVSLGPLVLSQYTAPAVLAIVINVATAISIKFFLDDSLHIPPKTETDSTKDMVESEDSGSGAVAQWLCARNAIRKVTSSTPPALRSTQTKGRSIVQYVNSLLQDTTPRLSVPLRMDVIAVIICMGTRSIRMLATSNIESIGAPFTEIMFNFTHAQALEWNSYDQTIVGALTIAVFMVYAFTNYTKWVSERSNCLIAITGLFVFYCITMPWPFLPGNVDCARFIGNGTHNWVWCEMLPPLNQWLYYVAYAAIYGICLPMLNNSLQALYSRVLGQGPQGTMQGVNQAVGSVARILGPLVMSSTFSHFDPQATWSVNIVLLAVVIGIWIVAYRRLVPLELRKTGKIHDSRKPSIVPSSNTTSYKKSVTTSQM